MTDDDFERLGREAERVVRSTPRRAKGYWARDYYRYPDADAWERDEFVSMGRQISAAIQNITSGEVTSDP